MNVSILIPVKNEAKLIAKTLKTIFSQNYNYSFEVIIIDSGSTDDTIKIIKKFPVKLIQIKPEEYDHGKTRNQLAKAAKGKYLIFTTGDAVPTDRYWLQNLVRHFKNPKVAGVFGRQIPPDGLNPLEKFFLLYSYNSKPKHFDKKNLKPFTIGNVIFSNVCSAVRADIFKKYQFPKTVLSEDQLWAYKVIQKGYSIVYEPEAQVVHGHPYSIKRLYNRYFLSGLSIDIPVVNTSKAFVNYLSFIIQEMVFLLQSRKAQWLLVLPFYEGLKIVAFMIGRRNQ